MSTDTINRTDDERRPTRRRSSPPCGTRSAHRGSQRRDRTRSAPPLDLVAQSARRRMLPDARPPPPRRRRGGPRRTHATRPRAGDGRRVGGLDGHDRQLGADDPRHAAARHVRRWCTPTVPTSWARERSTRRVSATVVDGGYRASGRWAFASGCQHADWFIAHCMVDDGSMPPLRMMVLPAADVDDRRHVDRGRPVRHGQPRLRPRRGVRARRPHLQRFEPGALESVTGRIPELVYSSLAIANVAVGIAEGALAEITTLATAKVPMFADATLAANPLFRHRLAEADACYGRPGRCWTPTSRRHGRSRRRLRSSRPSDGRGSGARRRGRPPLPPTSSTPRTRREAARRCTRTALSSGGFATSMPSPSTSSSSPTRSRSPAPCSRARTPTSPSCDTQLRNNRRMTDRADVEDLHRRLAEEEERLQYRRFGHDEAWQLGSRIRELARARDLPVAIGVDLGEQAVFRAGLPGSTRDNDRWLARKFATVRYFAKCSLATMAMGQDPGIYDTSASTGRHMPSPAAPSRSGSTAPSSAPSGSRASPTSRTTTSSSKPSRSSPTLSPSDESS